MGRPKNIQNKNTVAAFAYKLFMQYGYNKTTYKEIANTSGCSQGLVQHYFPNKELLILEFLSKVMSITEKFIIERSFKTDNDFVNLYLIGQIHFSFLLKNREISALAIDIISSRAITEQMLDFEQNWTFIFLEADPSLKAEMALNTAIAVGGVYELGYKYLIKGTPINIPDILKKVIINFMSGLGYESWNSDKILSNYALSDEVFSEANAYLKVALLTP